MDFSKPRSLSARQIVRALREDGFLLQRQKGSHRHYRHPDGRRVTVSFHRASDTFPIPTLKSMIERQARWTEEDIARLGLLK